MLTLECQAPSGVLERSTGRSLGLGVGSGGGRIYIHFGHTPGHFPGTTSTAPVAGKPPRPGLCPPWPPDLKHKGRLSQRNPPGAAPLPPPTSWPHGA